MRDSVDGSSNIMSNPEQTGHPELRRSLTLPLLILYGVGVTVGAGIYVLVGATAGRAGLYAPVSFVISAIIMGFTAGSFAELVGRYPVSAGEAAYVKAGFGSDAIALLTGCLVACAGIVSSAAISIGSAGYLREFVDLPTLWLVPGIVILMGGVAAWGILESVVLAAIFTVIEVTGLLIIIAAGFGGDANITWRLGDIVPPADLAVWSGIGAAGLLAFFAFIGFEDLVNVAEEAKSPRRTMPWAIFATLIITTTLYFLVVSVAVLAVGPENLSASEAPLALVFDKVTTVSPLMISGIAVIATLNTIIVQMIMVSRVLYGLGRQGNLPKAFTTISPVTRTPLVATAFVVVVVLVLALAFPLEGLAEMTSRITLTVFALVNMALIRLKLRHEKPDGEVFTVGLWVPITGFATSLLLLIGGAFV